MHTRIHAEPQAFDSKHPKPPPLCALLLDQADTALSDSNLSNLQPPSHTRTLNTEAMSDAYERERQNNSRLDELSAKVTALRGVTIDIYDNARDQGVIDSTVLLP
jgi:hypothetical protein